MAIRPVFRPLSRFPFVEEIPVEFTWYPGFAKSQTQKSLASLHSSAKQLGISAILEISTKSNHPVGISLSAFNLLITLPNALKISVECAFQGSKVFERGGPYNDLYTASSIEAKKDPRIRNSGELVSFVFFGESFPLNPITAFYDWLYINALAQNPSLANDMDCFHCFSDIAFNPQKSVNCQARSAALFLALRSLGEINKIIRDKKYFFDLISTPSKRRESHHEQLMIEGFSEKDSLR